MLTPMDIHAKEFGRSFRGFNENEVNDFLNEIMKAYTAVLDENERLRGELDNLLIVQIALVRPDDLLLLELPLEARLIVKDVVVDADHRVERTDRVDELSVVGIRHDDACQRVGHGHRAPNAVRHGNRIDALPRAVLRRVLAAAEHEQRAEKERAECVDAVFFHNPLTKIRELAADAANPPLFN